MAEIKGMTVSERLLIMDQLDEFEQAVREKNRALALKLLSGILQSEEEARLTVDQMLEDPDKFGI